MKLIILKTFQTTSGERNDDGAIKARQTQTPAAQKILISPEDLRLIIRKIKGMFQNGSTIAAIKATFCSI